MGGPGKNHSRREKAAHKGPASTSTVSTASVGSASTANQSHKSSASQATTKSASTIRMPQHDGAGDDKAKDDVKEKNALIKKIESAGMSMWSDHLAVKTTIPLPLRKGVYNKYGREVQLNLNTFDVVSLPTKPVYQFDVTMIGPHGAAARPTMMKVWKSQALQKALGNGNWIFDGNKLAWASVKATRIQVAVDLAVEEGRKPSAKNTFNCRIEPTKEVSFRALQGYLEQKIAFDESILESLAFLDHVMRETPTHKYTQVKKSFFARGETRFSLDQGVEALKGVYASVRMVTNSALKPALSVNVDVSNGTFFSQMDLVDSLAAVARCRDKVALAAAFNQARQGDWKKSNLCKLTKAFTHITVAKKYLGNKEVKIAKFHSKDPYEYSFEKQDRDADGNVTGRRMITVAQYFEETYRVRCTRGLPLVETTRKAKLPNGEPAKVGDLIPIEGLTLLPNQRYKIKLDDRQTANMIRFAVTVPKDRWASVQHGLRMLDWANDPNLQAYGLRISPNPTSVKGRILPCPEPTFGNGKIDAKSASQGRWRIDGKKFIEPNRIALKSWGIIIVDGGRGACVNQTQAQHFASAFMRVYRGHGGVIANDPHLMMVRASRGGDMITDAWNGTGTKFQAKPNMLFFIVPDKNSELYRRIKKGCECRYGIVSQVMQSAHVVKAQDQYISNVCMKVNAKLGGATCVAAGGVSSGKLNSNWGKVPTIIIGADVSHAAPGDDGTPSMAAFTMSLDRRFLRYAANCDVNGSRVEIISTHNINTTLKTMVEMWVKTFGGNVPHQVVYYRDGVSEGQYQFVLNQEVSDMKAMFHSLNPKIEPKFTVIICGKRHHVRFFPGRGGDRNENPVPGTLVETGVTHPFELDFYLNSHSAIKGTARPVHYNVIANENNYDIGFIEQLTFEHCMQYARSTTPVSMVPPVYYAHLASNRAVAHKSQPEASSGRKDALEGKKKDDTLSTSSKSVTFPPNIPLNNQSGILSQMWYI